MSQALAAEVENPAFFDAFACVRAAAISARNLNRLAVRARLAGDDRAASKHQAYADWLIARARMWRAEMEGVTDE